MISISFTILVIMLCVVLYKIYRFIGEIQQPTEKILKELNRVVIQTHFTIVEANILIDDIKKKSRTIDPLFTTVSELSESLSDINASGRNIVSNMQSARTKKRRTSITTILIIGIAKQIYKRKKNKK
ncbi:DUF948 domain-containing protein [Lactococcus taiwanensis]|uniref:DUF948 domain-containing protein n=1 Tax=Lactococcus taiwanensis TaxID=1151742 RepID=UPI0028990FA1|nr:DUF948 domain-containing protein [Lactococcus taiwanensis]